MEDPFLPLNLTEYQVAAIKQRLAVVRSDKADYTPNLTTEVDIRESCAVLGAYSGQIDLLNSIIDEALNPITDEEN